MKRSHRGIVDALDRRIGSEVHTRRLLPGMTQEKLGGAPGVSFE